MQHVGTVESLRKLAESDAGLWISDSKVTLLVKETREQYLEKQGSKEDRQSQQVPDDTASVNSRASIASYKQAKFRAKANEERHAKLREEKLAKQEKEKRENERRKKEAAQQQAEAARAKEKEEKKVTKKFQIKN